jgi:deoxyhypusine synthase
LDDSKIFSKKNFMHGKKITPVMWKENSGITDIIKDFKDTCFEARNVADGAELLEYMINNDDTIWLGVAGAGPAGGMGGYIKQLIEKGFIDVICSTGAQVYHDAHFAYDLPIVQGPPRADDNALDRVGTTRIYDIYIRRNETLIAQDGKFRKFSEGLTRESIRSTADYVHEWGKYLWHDSPHPERSWAAAAAKCGVPIFLDSESNHSIGMNNASLFADGININISPHKSLLQGAAILYNHPQTGFFEWGGGGPKNWIQTLAPMLSQIVGIEFEGADRGLQITTAPEHDGGLSGCTFGEAVTWGKYKDVKKGLVQIRCEYSPIVPLIVGYAIENCKARKHKRIYDNTDKYYNGLLTILAECRNNKS